jgi:hypothetical protein
MCKSTVEPDRPQKTVCRMRIACWIPKNTNTHSEYVILTVLPLQQWLSEHASILRCKYIACVLLFRYVGGKLKNRLSERLLLDSVNEMEPGLACVWVNLLL